MSQENVELVLKFVQPVRGGKIAHVEFYVTNHTEALAALGLSEQNARADF